MLLSLVIPYLGSSDTSCLYHAAEVRLQGDQYILEVHCWGGQCHICPHTQHQPLDLFPKKVGDDIVKVISDWKGLGITVKLTIENRQAQIEVVLLPPPGHQNPQRTIKRKKRSEKNIKHSENITSDDIVNIAQPMQH